MILVDQTSTATSNQFASWCPGILTIHVDKTRMLDDCKITFDLARAHLPSSMTELGVNDVR